MPEDALKAHHNRSALSSAGSTELISARFDRERRDEIQHRVDLKAVERDRPSDAESMGRTLSNQRTTEWAETLELVKEACDSIRISEERVALLEAELEQANLMSRSEIQNMAARLEAAKEEIQSANDRAEAMEFRAIEAEMWLGKINEALHEGFGAFVNRNSKGRR